MRLTPDMITHGNVFPSGPFYRGDISRQFFSAVKDGDLVAINRLLRADRFLLYEFDDQKMTPLHWAAQRG